MDGRLGQASDIEPSSSLSSTSHSVENVTDTGSLLQVVEKLVSDDIEKEKEMPSLLQDSIGVDVVDIACGLDHSLILSRSGSSLSCGNNTYGRRKQNYQLGKSYVNHVPSKVVGLEGGDTMLVCGGHVHSLALSSMKEMWAWGCGKNRRLELGSSRYEAKPTLVECLQEMEVIQISLGLNNSLVLVASHSR
ncbi:hypothetical protein AMTR_s00169p00024450 [Amborella trichopoda]|uniref:Regulator of chromosome condensation 1/beta-lactamase-inhibitor protein II n=1 Tax=Amborella trichopoda TaxID=13333 RepID=W1PQX9_AMBTC|nr:hypothetical protein AMTR_s00169p00024450 [Amborella trichopoda]